MFRSTMTTSQFEGTNPIPSIASRQADQAIYVYAFVATGQLDGLQVTMHADRPLLIHSVETISALVNQVSAAEFCSIDAERNMAEPAWIMPRIRHHEAVVETAMKWSPVFPLRFATLYASLDSLTDYMRQHSAAIASFLRQVDGQEEWAVTVTAELDDLAALDNLATELCPGWDGYSAGERYLRLRQERPFLLKEAMDRAAQQIPVIVDGLRTYTTAMRSLARSGARQDSDKQHVEAYALLARVDRRMALRDQISELAAACERQRFHIALSGPWPPYSFRPLLDGKFRQQGVRTKEL
jgi:hypothetical protein